MRQRTTRDDCGEDDGKQRYEQQHHDRKMAEEQDVLVSDLMRR